MSLPQGQISGLASLANWLQDSPDTNALDHLLVQWVRTAGWRMAGIVWPANQASATLSKLIRPHGVEPLTVPPAEAGDVLRTLQSDTTTVLWQVPGTVGRLYSLLQPPGREAGVLWIEKSTLDPWTDLEREFLVLSARMIERSPALSAKLGPFVDSERLRHRLSDAAIIAGRMAHDFDNILTGIIGFADLSVPLVGKVPQAASYISEIGKVGQKGIQFTQQLHQLSRSGQTKPLPTNIQTAVAKEEARLQSALAPGITITKDIPTNLPAVAMEHGPFSLVLGHLLDNAMEATPATGPLQITARLVELSDQQASTYLGQVKAGAFLEITVQDAGPGIKPEIRSKLFAEPFYTTKVRHRGLGLAVVFRTLYSHGGGILIEHLTTPHTGTRVRVVIPPAAVRPAVISPTRPMNSLNYFGG